ncbi:putative type I restriction enzyme S protein [Ligilactobacillus ruminis DPC 6832]|uniref:Putative type I restriction enzyme S protein n=1 Tax=Ligilactobacillus ruminis DPC 6832 TaxID=1402208 RepID=A0A837DSH9_9LACO|nr:putative type I restriction enzyme S protein [Ligilactobacillus ruminis DPC 6832]
MVWNEEVQRDIPEGWGSEKLKDVIVENPKSKIKVGDVKNIGEVPFFTSGAEILSTNDSNSFRIKLLFKYCWQC